MSDEKKQPEMVPAWVVVAFLAIGVVMGSIAGYSIGSSGLKQSQDEVRWYRVDRDRYQKNAEDWQTAYRAKEMACEQVLTMWQKQWRDGR